MCTYVLMISRYYNELSKQFLSWNPRRRLKYHSLIMFKITEKTVFIWWKTKCANKSMSYTRVQLHNISANWYICSWDGIFLEKGICFVWMAHLKTVMEKKKKKVNLYMWRRKQKDQNALIIDRFSAAWKQKLKTKVTADILTIYQKTFPNIVLRMLTYVLWLIVDLWTTSSPFSKMWSLKNLI